MGYNIMLGCMVSSSLAMAPALLLESFADVIDLDGALLLARDHDDGMIYSSGTVSPAPKTLWGYPRKI
jgi:L-alanine-DL-glutamate epimerase-like enolase superfamily enzyme